MLVLPVPDRAEDGEEKAGDVEEGDVIVEDHHGEGHGDYLGCVFGIRVRVYVCECVYLVFKCQTKREVKKSRHYQEKEDAFHQ